jgi:phosphoribosylaminoimidazole-succinocarboxamide synthase
VLVETFLKDDANHDPQIWEQDIVDRGLATKEEIDWMTAEGRRVFEALEHAWASADVMLVDLKIEFGRNINGKLMVADVIDNDSWHIWLGGDKNCMLDKQVYRNLTEVTEQDLQALGDRYALVADLPGKLKLDESAVKVHPHGGAFPHLSVLFSGFDTLTPLTGECLACNEEVEDLCAQD